MATSIFDRAVAYKQFLDTILASGPDIQDDLTDIAFIRDAIGRIVNRTVNRFGKRAVATEIISENDWGEIRKDSGVQALEAQVVAAMSSATPGDKAAGPMGGPLVDILTQLFQFLMANPQLLQLLIGLLKKP
jgi:hypothetical protein